MLKKTKKNLAVQGIFYKLPRESPPQSRVEALFSAHTSPGQVRRLEQLKSQEFARFARKARLRLRCVMSNHPPPPPWQNCGANTPGCPGFTDPARWTGTNLLSPLSSPWTWPGLINFNLIDMFTLRFTVKIDRGGEKTRSKL